MIALTVSILAGCGSPRSTVDDKSTVEQGVALYIAGDHAGAELLFLEVLDNPESDEDLVTAHLYLGRIYLEANEYQKAADVLSAGRALGGDVRFDEYFEIAASHLRASSSQIIQEDVISRGQLAALLMDMFGDVLDREMRAGTREESDTTHWAEGCVHFAETTGVMKKLPDGSFHEDANVTRPAFFMVVARLAHLLGLEDGVEAEAFPGGFREAVVTLDAENTTSGNEGYVSGREALSVLGIVARAAGI